MDIQSFYEPASGTWTHLLIDPDSQIAAVIDPVWVYDPVSGMTDTGFVDTVLRAAEQRNCRIDWVLETHAHADHLTAADVVKKRTGARVACSRGIRRSYSLRSAQPRQRDLSGGMPEVPHRTVRNR